jgi:hypothetical protein
MIWIVWLEMRIFDSNVLCFLKQKGRKYHTHVMMAADSNSAVFVLGSCAHVTHPRQPCDLACDAFLNAVCKVASEGDRRYNGVHDSHNVDSPDYTFNFPLSWVTAFIFAYCLGLEAM